MRASAVLPLVYSTRPRYRVFAARPENVAVCVWIPTVAGLTTPESVVLPAEAVPTDHVNSVPVAAGALPVLNPWMYTVRVRSAPVGASVTSSLESPSALLPSWVAPL